MIVIISFYKKRSIGHYQLIIPNLTTTQKCAMKARKHQNEKCFFAYYVAMLNIFSCQSNDIVDRWNKGTKWVEIWIGEAEALDTRPGRDLDRVLLRW